MRWLVRALVAVAVLLLVVGGASAAAFAYDAAHRHELLPGVTIGGLPAGDRHAAAVLQAVEHGVAGVGETAVQVVAADQEARLRLDQLGLRSDAAGAMARAQADAEGLGTARRVYHRLLGKPLRRDYDVRLRVDRPAVEAAVAELGRRVHQPAVDARVDTSTGMVTVLPAASGRTLDVAAVTERVHHLVEGVANGEAAPAVVEVEPKVVEPAVTGFTDVLLVRTAENRLYHYEDGALVKTYTIATGTARYPTPKGTFDIVLKRRNPTWVNPDPGGWGRSMPARIGPGPRNPLGTRALNLDAPGIRIHGTSNVASLGRNASHGCIRMAMADVEELFDRVEQGTPVAIVEGPPPAQPDPAAGPVESSVPGAPTPDVPVDLDAG
ncbi:MAG TPA: L,D-transpeptidase family protein [Acidimicrobiales bacterium]|nr:L,D-transpeptidase family protein [Acidimicrobiales bacterium]